MQFKKADKKASKLRCSVFGPSGSGKTFTSLRIANGFKSATNGKIAFIDSERGSASKYADRFDFDVLELERKTIADYIQAIKLASDNGYNILIIDSLSHAWQELIEDIDRLANVKYKGNTWRAWSEGTPKQRALIDSIINYPGHVIATIRSKTEWEVGEDKKVRRVGLSPEQGKGIEYEFDMLMEITVDHYATVIKDRTGKYQDKIINMPDEKFGVELINWLNSGSAIPDAIPPKPSQSSHNRETPLPAPVQQKSTSAPKQFDSRETFNKFKTAISESLLQFDLNRFIKASQTFEKYISKLDEDVFEEYEHYMQSALTTLTEHLQDRNMMPTENHQKDLVKLFTVWQHEINRVCEIARSLPPEETIF